MPVNVDDFAGEQRNCYERFLEEYEKGRKVLWCVLGLAGTGKTTLLKAIQNSPHNELGGPRCLATAHVATAANMIGAKTINSTFLLDGSRGTHRDIEIANEKMYERLRSADVLLIDNVHYVDAETFVAIDQKLKTAFGNQEPFGGISVILFGDLYQQGQNRKPSIYGGANDESRVLWQMFKLFELTHNYKYESEEEWEILQEIALRGPTEAAERYLRKYCQMNRENDVANDVENAEAEIVANKLRQLRAQGGRFAVIAPKNYMVGNVQNLLKDTAVEQRTFDRVNEVRNINLGDDPDFHLSDNTDISIDVSRGCSVMLTINLNDILHGTVGVVERFDEDSIYVRFEGRASVEEINRIGWYCRDEGWYQFPLLVIEDVYNYQMSQGMSFDGLIIVRNLDWGLPAAPLYEGQFYSAISRAKSLKNCRITPIDKKLTWTVQAGATAEMERLRNANN